jgi:hypothetical protein
MLSDNKTARVIFTDGTNGLKAIDFNNETQAKFYTMNLDSTVLTDLDPNSQFIAVVIRSMLSDDTTILLTVATKEYQIWDITYHIDTLTYTADA